MATEAVGENRPPVRDSAGWPLQAPPWFRRGVVVVLIAVAAYQAAAWTFQNLDGFLGLVFLAWLFSVSVEPIVDRLVRRGLRRGLATALVMFGLTVVGIAFVAVFGALLVDQLTDLVTGLPDVVGAVVDWVNGVFGTTFVAADVNDSLRLTPERIEDLVRELTPGVVGIISSLFGLFLQVFTFLLFAYYMSAQGPQLRRTVSSWFPPRQQRVIATVWEIAVDKTGSYLAARLMLAGLSAVLTGAFLWLLDVPFWLPLGIWTGVVSQFIPTVGTYLGIALPALIALAEQPLDALWVVLFGVVYQQIENYVVAPRITARTMAIHPAVSFGAVIAGATLFGPLGAMVAVPVVAAIQAVIETYGRRYELAGRDDTDAATRPDPGPGTRPDTRPDTGPDTSSEGTAVRRGPDAPA